MIIFDKENYDFVDLDEEHIPYTSARDRLQISIKSYYALKNNHRLKRLAPMTIEEVVELRAKCDALLQKRGVAINA